MGKSLSLDEFKNLVSTNNPFKTDVIDMEHGKMTIHRCNVTKYLEKYMCQNEDDLDNTLYRSFGVWLNIID